MTKEQYKVHLCDVIYMVFTAEHIANEKDPTLKVRLKSKDLMPDEYVNVIAEEIIDKAEKDTEHPAWEDEDYE